MDELRKLKNEIHHGLNCPIARALKLPDAALK
jgi:hypothetical protein